MGKKKHRPSLVHDGPPVGNAPQTPTEDALTVSPVQVAYPTDVAEPAVEEPPFIEAPHPVEEATASEEAPLVEEATATQKGFPLWWAIPAEEPAPVKEAIVCEEAIPPDELPAVEAAFPTEEAAAVIEDAVVVEDVAVVEVALPIEEAAVVEEAAVAEEVTVVEEPRAASEEGPAAADPPIEEAKADFEPEAAAEAEDTDKKAAGNARKKRDDQVGEVILVCTSCTVMLLIEYVGPCPYSALSRTGSHPESHSSLLHTTCFSCANRHKGEWTSRERFSQGCTEAFEAAVLSEEFMKATSWFATAGKVCRKPVRIVMGGRGRSVACAKIDVMREETTDKCRIKGLKSVGSRGGSGSSNDILDSFVPGGFL